MANKIFKLITEEKTPVELIHEPIDTTKPKTLKFKGCMLVSEQVNGNNRVYPYELLKQEVDRLRIELIDTDRCLMELEHPSSSEIDPMRACARLLSLKEDNKTWIGEGIILCSDEKFGIKGTPCGDVLASLANYGTKFGVSSRALGDVSDDGIVTELHLVTLDVVTNPSIGQMVTSDGNRFVNGILESKHWVCTNHGEMVESKYNAFEKRLSRLDNTFISSKRAHELGTAVHDFFQSLVK